MYLYDQGYVCNVIVKSGDRMNSLSKMLGRSIDLELMILGCTRHVASMGDISNTCNLAAAIESPEDCYSIG